MKKFTEKTFGTNFTKAKNLATLLESYSNYQPIRDYESVANFKQLIADVQKANQDVATTKQNWSLSVDQRKQLFSINNISLKKLLTPIFSGIKSQYGFTSKQTIDITAKIKNLRGAKVKKPPSNVEVAHPNEIPAAVSQSHQAFGTVLHNFEDLIFAIEQFDPVYAPVNQNLSILNLKSMNQKLYDLNDQLLKDQISLQTARNNRNELYASLKDSAKRIKESVVSQYGAKSTESLNIKALKIS